MSTTLMREPSPPPTPEPSGGSTSLDVRLMWSLGLLVFSARLAVFAYAGSPVPFFDQWVLEFNNTFLGFLGGRSPIDILFVRHSEHLVTTTQLLSAAGFMINGYWDVRFLLVVSAIVRMFEAMLAFAILSECRGPRFRHAIWWACVVAYVAPISGYNLLCGMQVCFFIVHVLLFWSIRTVIRWDNPLSGSLNLLIATGLGVLSLGSAIAIPAAVLAVHILHRRRRPGFIATWCVTAAIVIGVTFYLAGAYRGNAPSNSLLEQLGFLLRLLSWPTMSVVFGAVLLAGAIVWISRTVQQRGTLDPGIASGAALAIFAATNAGMIAMNRMPSQLQMRHWDTLMLGVLGLFAVLVGLSETATHRRRLACWLTAALGIAYLISLGGQWNHHTGSFLQDEHYVRTQSVNEYRHLLLTGKISEKAQRLLDAEARGDHESIRQIFDVHMPDPVVVANMMQNPVVSLPLLSPELVPVRKPSVVGRVTDLMIGAYWVPGLLGIGLAAFGLVGLSHRVRRRMRRASNGGI
jgi:hypothetical protein